MQVHDEVAGLGVPVPDLALVTVRVGHHQLGPERASTDRRGRGRTVRSRVGFGCFCGARRAAATCWDRDMSGDGHTTHMLHNTHRFWRRVGMDRVA